MKSDGIQEYYDNNYNDQSDSSVVVLMPFRGNI
jgi:hypothetical protein